jgi:large subunit ribosomal protein L25
MIFKIDAAQRETMKKSDMTKFRKEGLIPAIIYGSGTDTVNISLQKADFMKLYKKSFGELAFYEIKVGTKNYHTLMKERQIHPVSREIIHIDFMVVKLHQKLELEVPIKFVGTAVGTKTGGTLDIVQRTIKIQCMEEDIPDDIEVDITNLAVGEALHVHQIPVGKWTVKENPDSTIATVHAKKIDVAPAPAEPKPEEKRTED